MIGLHTDLYQLTMAQTYYFEGDHNHLSVFEFYFRTNPFNSGYAVFAGLERVVSLIEQFHFTEEELAFLREEGFKEEFLEYLKTLRFTGDIFAMKEGEVVFAKEPILVVKAPLIQAQILETLILNVVNYQTLVASKASRIRHVAQDKLLFEFGARRAQEIDAALWGSRAAYLAGFDATSLVQSGKRFKIPIVGTHAHSFVQKYRSEIEAFRAYARNNCDVSFLVDTYDTLKSGLPNAIKVADEFKEKITLRSIRIDSGDLAYQSKEARKLLDKSGYKETKIIASNDLDEETIMSLMIEDAKIDGFGIGTKLVTSYSQPALGGVFKLVAFEEKGKLRNVIKISSNKEKITTPGFKKAYRIINEKKNKSEGDYIAFVDEEVPTEELTLFDEMLPHLNKTVKNYRIKQLHQQIFENGKCIYKLPTIKEIRQYHQDSMQEIWDEHKRLHNPAKYYVDLSEKLYEAKQELLKAYLIED